MTSYEIFLAIIGGFIAGCINTLAGNGSVLTLGFLTEIMGMPGNLANGTNRIGIFIQGLASLEAFQRNKKIPLKETWHYLVIGIIGAIIGALVAIRISPDGFKEVYKYLVLSLLIPVFLALGFYGGFIQMGMGIFFLAVMVYVAKLPIIEANAVKVLMVTSYTIIVIGIFHVMGYVDWKIGGTIALGQGAGGWITAHTVSKIPNADKVAYYFLIAIMIFTLLHLFGVFGMLGIHL